MGRYRLSLAASCAALLLSGAALAAPPGALPRLADGHPAFDGVWTNVSITPLERDRTYGPRLVPTPDEVARVEGAAVKRFEEGNKPTDPNQDATDHTSKKCASADGLDCGYNSFWKDSGVAFARVDGKPRSSSITSTPDGRIPDRRAGAAAPKGRIDIDRVDNPEDRGLGERCLTSFGYSAGPVMLPLMYNNNYGFIRTRDELAIQIEMVHDVRHIRIGATTHPPADVRLWFGDSIGHWEGDTLVSETTNYRPEQSIRGSDANLKVVERFTMKGPGRLHYAFTVIDPTVWEKPWGGEYEFTPSKGQIYEYACHEGNYALKNMLAGARVKDPSRPTRTAAAGS
ncbi:hypothetical protein BH09PSE2_BH09PSE2_07010 [soil metagenome]